jgi:NifU-like protein involved in Fe-S cluster formation
MIDDIYSQKILQLAGNIGRIGSLVNADARVHKVARLCGSTVTVYLNFENDVVSDFAHEVRACALGQAASAIMAQQIVGATSDELRSARLQMLSMLAGEGEGPDGRFEQAKLLMPVKDFKSRHGSVMLTFDAVCEALDQINAKPRSFVSQSEE